jgi:trimethylamine--corrinoid protein Co-methyltransferase
MVIAIYGGDENAIVKKPIGIRSVCPSPPLKWTNIVAETAFDAAKLGIPVQILPMGLVGANAPATLVGTLVQHTAENLSGVVFAQVIRQGIPVVFGGSPILFDMKNGTTPLGAIETQMVNAAYPQIGKYLRLPTQSFLGLSDSKEFDAQAGFESGIGIILGALTGTNMMQGVGQMYFESAFCNLKLVLDNDICGMAKRLVRGFEPREDNFAVNLMRQIVSQGIDFLSSDHTRKWFKKESFYPSVVVDRRTEKRWITEGKNSLIARASELAKKLIESYKPKVLNKELEKELDKIMLREFKKYGVNTLPKVEI